MLYNLKDVNDRDTFRGAVNEFYSKQCIVELKKYYPKRSNSQNSYLHLILNYWGSYYGCNAEYVKQEIFKKICNREIFTAEGIDKFGRSYEYMRSSADLSTAEMTVAIERFRNWSVQQDPPLYIPSPEERDLHIGMINEIEKVKQYL